MPRRKFILACIFILAICAMETRAASCVWKITKADGKTLYLGGSVHALRKSDYPLPAAFQRAFENSSQLALEVDAQALRGAAKNLAAAGEYKKGDSLKNHVDPRTYDYVRRVCGLLNVPEEKLQRARPWWIVLNLQTLGLHGLSPELGVDQFLMKRAQQKKEPVTGLESVEEHARIFSGLSDHEAEILLLVTFIPNVEGTKGNSEMLSAWRRGDADTLTKMTRTGFQEFPAFANRLLDARNRAWMPKIENFLASGRTCFVVVGGAHLGGSAGLLSLLNQRGYKIEQL